MGQLGSRLSLFLESLHETGILAELRLHHLDSYQTVQLVVLCLIHICHTAGTDPCDDLIPLA